MNVSLFILTTGSLWCDLYTQTVSILHVHFVLWTVRQKAKELVEFVQDDDRVREERRKAKKTKDKYVGMAGEAISRQYSM